MGSPTPRHSMIEYLHALNIDTRLLKRAATILNEGGLVAYPTDTSWSIGCSIQSRVGVAKLQKLKGGKSFTPTIMCREISQWSEFANVDTAQFRFVKPLVPGPFVFIFRSLGSFEKKFDIKRPAVGLRIPNHPVPLALIEALGHPLFSSTASRVMTDLGWWDSGFAEENLFEYGYELEDIPGVDLILDHGDSLPKQLSTVLDLTEDEPRLIRQGCGVL